METGSEGESNRNNNECHNGQSDGPKKPKRQMKTPFQLGMLEQTYSLEMYPSEATRAKLSEKLGLTDRQLQMWFCHRRLKDKKEGAAAKRPPAANGVESLKSPKEEQMVSERGGSGSGSDHGSWSRSRHEPRSQSDVGSGSGSEPESDSSPFDTPVVQTRPYESTPQKMIVRRIVDCVEAQLGELLREDGPALGVEFDQPPPGAFGTPIVIKKRPSQARHSYNEDLFEQPEARPNKVDVISLQESAVPGIKPEPYGTVSRFYDSPVGYHNDSRLVVQNGHLPHAYGSGIGVLPDSGRPSSPPKDDDLIQPNEEVMQMWRKRKSDDAVSGREVQSNEKRIRKELEKQDMLRRKREEQMRKEMEKQDRERRKEEERMMRERQRQEERYQREEKRELERREKFLQRESLKAERRRQKEELRREKEAIRMKAAVEKAAARKITKESMELIEDERLELLELAAASKGLTSIVSLDYETLQNLDSFRDSLCVFPPKPVQARLKRPFSVRPWTDSEDHIGNLLMVWRFCMTFADVLGLWPFTLDEFVQALHDYDSRLLGEVHIALLRLIVRDIEDVARTPAGGPGTNQYTIANPEGGHPQIVEGAYMWGFDIRNWLKHLNPLTWPEILRQFALSAGLGPRLKKDNKKRSGLPENDEGKDSQDIIVKLCDGSAAREAVTLMQEKGVNLHRKSRHRLTPGTVKFAAYHVLCLEGDKGLNVLELAEKIQKSGLRDLTTSKTPDASISVALSRDPILFERIAPSTYCVRPAFRKDPETAEEVISSAKEKIQRYGGGLFAGVNVEDVEKDEDYECDEIDEFGNKGGNDYNEDVKGSGIGKDDVFGNELDRKTEVKNAGVGTVGLDQSSTEVDESKPGEPWVHGLTEGEYSDLTVEERLDALVALIGIANEGNIIRVVLEDRLDAATAVRKQMWSEAQLDKKRFKEECITKFHDSSSLAAAAAEGNQSPLPPTADIKTGDGLPPLLASHDGSAGQSQPNGYNTAERSRSQLKAYIGHKAEEMYVYRSLPLGQDRRRNRYWQFVASASKNDPGMGRIFVELQNGPWRLIDSEEAFDALLSSLDTRGARESHLHIMLLKIENLFKESVRRNTGRAVGPGDGSPNSVTGPNFSSSFEIGLGRNDSENKNFLQRYQDFETWMWKECLYSSGLWATAHGKRRGSPVLGICDSCHAVYGFGNAICPRCRRTFGGPFGGKLNRPELEVHENDGGPNICDWDISDPLRIRLIKSLVTYIEATVPSEALQSSWMENERKAWGIKLNGSSSPWDLLQITTQLESVVRRDYLSLDFETTEELIGGAVCGPGPVLVLPWIPQTTAAVSLRLLELDASVFYDPQRKAEFDVAKESKDIVLEKSPLKFTFLKNLGKTATTEIDHGKNPKQPARGGGGGRSRGGKLQKRAVTGALSVSSSRQSLGDNVTMSQAMTTMQQQHGRGRRTVRRRRPEKPTEPPENFNGEEQWVDIPIDKMETETETAGFHVSEDESDEDGDRGVRFPETSVYDESRWAPVEMTDEDDEVGDVDGFALEDENGRNFKDEDSDSFVSGEYSD